MLLPDSVKFTVANKFQDTFLNPLYSPMELSVSFWHVRQRCTAGDSVVMCLCCWSSYDSNSAICMELLSCDDQQVTWRPSHQQHNTDERV